DRDEELQQLRAVWEGRYVPGRSVPSRTRLHRRFDLRRHVLELQREVRGTRDEVVPERAQPGLHGGFRLPGLSRDLRSQAGALQPAGRAAPAEALRRSRSPERYRPRRSLLRSRRTWTQGGERRPAVQPDVVADRSLRARPATAELLRRRL